MTKIEDKKQITKMAFLFAFTYMTSYITRINYGCVISEMVSATGFSKSALSMAVTGSFITYGAGQVVSGICGDRFSPKKLIFYAFIVTILMNAILPFCNNPYQMLCVWCVNGFAQAFMWPPLVKIMTSLLSDEEYKKMTVKVSWGSSGGTILLYLISPALIALFSWKAIFLFAAISGIICLIVWNRFAIDVPVEPRKLPKENSKKISRGIFLSPLMLGVMLAIILQGMLRDGITTWMPSYISETYQLSNIVSILTGVILPIFSITCFQITSRLYRKKFTNPLQCSGVIFAGGMVAALCLFLVSEKSAAASVLFSAMLTGCMHGVNLILICMIPAFFQKYGIVSTASGVLNACTYIGSALSTYGFAVLAEQLGWRSTVFSWFLVCVVGVAICFLCVKSWKREFEETL